MSEKLVEQSLVNRVKALGGIAFKFTSPGRRSVPDRLCLFPGGRVIFVECKSLRKRPTALQAREHDRLRALGFDVRVIDSKEAANALT